MWKKYYKGDIRRSLVYKWQTKHTNENKTDKERTEEEKQGIGISRRQYFEQNSFNYQSAVLCERWFNEYMIDNT